VADLFAQMQADMGATAAVDDVKIGPLGQDAAAYEQAEQAKEQAAANAEEAARRKAAEEEEQAILRSEQRAKKKLTTEEKLALATALAEQRQRLQPKE